MLRSIQNFLLGVAATDFELLRWVEGENPMSHSRQVRSVLGGIILLTFLVTWASTAWMAMTFGVNIYVSTIIGLIAGLIKLEWDRRVAIAANVWVTCGRMVLAIPLSIAMAITPAMAIFGDYAEGVSKEEERTNITETYEEDLNERERLMAEVDSLRGGQSLFQTLAKVEEGGLTQREAGLTDEQLERYGVKVAPSGKQGCGDRCETYQERAKGYESALGAKKQQLSVLPSQLELKTHRDSALNALEQQNTDVVTRLSKFYESTSESPFTFWVFLGFVGLYGVVDLLPALERIFSADQYTKAQLDRIREQSRKREIERAKRQGEQRKKRAAAWMETLFYEQVLKEANSGDISPERLIELADKLDEFKAREDSLSGESEEGPSEQEQGTTAEAGDAPRSEGMSGGSPDLRPGPSAGDGAPPPKEESDSPDTPGSEAPRENRRLLLPPANGQGSG